jgi:hypothetical protein
VPGHVVKVIVGFSRGEQGIDGHLRPAVFLGKAAAAAEFFESPAQSAGPDKASGAPEQERGVGINAGEPFLGMEGGGESARALPPPPGALQFIPKAASRQCSENDPGGIIPGCKIRFSDLRARREALEQNLMR